MITTCDRLLVTAVLGLLTLAACASGPQFETEGVNEAVTPAQAVDAVESWRGEEVLWGGVIVNSENLENATRFEVLSYPLDRSQRPDTTQSATGRFLVIQEGYIETADYAPGRQLTIKGELTDTREGKIGEADYTYPLVEADRVYLWPLEESRGGRSGFNFGVGIGIVL